MSRTTRILRRMLVLGVLLYGVQLLFTHWLFNMMLHRVVAKSLPDGSEISFSSYFVVFPHPQIRVRHFEYTGTQQRQIKLASLDASIATNDLWRQRRLDFTALKGQGWTIQLPQSVFDRSFKQLMFHWIRSKIGVQAIVSGKTPGSQLKKLSLQALNLVIHEDGQSQQYQIQHLNYGVGDSGYPNVTLCFNQPDHAQSFYQRYIAIYRIAGNLKDACITFERSNLGQRRV